MSLTTMSLNHSNPRLEIVCSRSPQIQMTMHAAWRTCTFSDHTFLRSRQSQLAWCVGTFALHGPTGVHNDFGGKLQCKIDANTSAKHSQDVGLHTHTDTWKTRVDVTTHCNICRSYALRCSTVRYHKLFDFATRQHDETLTAHLACQATTTERKIQRAWTIGARHCITPTIYCKETLNDATARPDAKSFKHTV